MALPALQSDPAVPFGAAMVLVGAVVLAACARYVWRASAAVRASDADSLDGVADGASVDPVVVSDRPPGGTLYRMARTSPAGLAVGLGGVLLGALLPV